MKKSCGTWFAVYLILAGAVATIVYRRFPVPEAAAGAGFFGGIVLWLGFGYFWGIKKKMADSRMIRRALAGDPPLDGEKIAAIGRIEPAGAALTSPFSKTACVGYKYEISDGYGQHSQIHYEGFALTPSMIQAQQGSIRLLGWPDLQFNPTDVPTSIALQNAQEYIAATQFSEPAIMNIRQSIAKMMEIYRDDDGTVRFDQLGMQPLAAAKGNQPPVIFENLRYREWLLRPGESVCVTGTYSVERGGIVPSKQPIVDPVTLEVGPPDAFSGRAITGATGYFIGGSIFVGIALVALAAFFTFVPLDASEQMAPTFQPSWPEIRLEQLVEKRLRVPLRRAGMLDANESVSVTLPAGSASGRVRSGSVDQSVSRAVARTTGDETTIDIDNGTVTLSTDAKGHPTRLAIMRHEVPLGDASIQVSDATGRITYVSDERACHITFRAN